MTRRWHGSGQQLDAQQWGSWHGRIPTMQFSWMAVLVHEFRALASTNDLLEPPLSHLSDGESSFPWFSKFSKLGPFLVPLSPRSWSTQVHPVVRPGTSQEDGMERRQAAEVATKSMVYRHWLQDEIFTPGSSTCAYYDVAFIYCRVLLQVFPPYTRSSMELGSRAHFHSLDGTQALQLVWVFDGGAVWRNVL